MTSLSLLPGRSMTSLPRRDMTSLPVLDMTSFPGDSEISSLPGRSRMTLILLLAREMALPLLACDAMLPFRMTSPPVWRRRGFPLLGDDVSVDCVIILASVGATNVDAEHSSAGKLDCSMSLAIFRLVSSMQLRQQLAPRVSQN
jgi:hypothetical protein